MLYAQCHVYFTENAREFPVVGRNGVLKKNSITFFNYRNEKPLKHKGACNSC